MTFFSNFQKNINALMDQRGWGDSALGERVGMKGPQVSRYKKGHNEPGMEQLEKFCAAFQVSVADLLGEEVPKSVGPSPDEHRLACIAAILKIDGNDLSVVRDFVEKMASENVDSHPKGKKRGSS